VLYDYTKKQYVHVNTGSIVETYEEINYLFSLEKYKSQLKKIWEESEIRIADKFKSQILSELNNLPEHLSVSRPAKRVPWGILIPNDDQTIYVWVDALINYYTALGYPDTQPDANNEFTNIVHVLGKDIMRFHALIWPSLLLANKCPLPKELVTHNFWLMKNVSWVLSC